MKRILLIVSILLLGSACGQQPGAGGSDFKSQEAAWESAMKAGDVEAMVSLYADDARLMPPNGTTLVGHDGVRSSFGGLIDAGLSIDLTPVQIDSAGDVAFVVGTYELFAGEDVADAGKYIETWQRGAGGDWRLTNDIWNSDRPPAGGGDGNVHVMVYHEVEDGDHWLAAWSGNSSRRDQFKANGVAHVHAFRNADNPNLTGLVFSVNDMDAFNAFLASEEGAMAAEADGVNLDETTILVEAR